MYKQKVKLKDTTEIVEFVNITSMVNGKVKLVDDDGFCINGKSFLGVMAAMEWENLYCESEEDISEKIAKFIV